MFNSAFEVTLKVRIGRLFTFYGPPQYLFSSSSWRPKSKKNYIFQEFVCRFGKKFCRPSADSILMPPSFHIAIFNRYTPKFSGVPQKLTRCQSFGLHIRACWIGHQSKKCPKSKRLTCFPMWNWILKWGCFPAFFYLRPYSAVFWAFYISLSLRGKNGQKKT